MGPYKHLEFFQKQNPQTPQYQAGNNCTAQGIVVLYLR